MPEYGRSLHVETPEPLAEVPPGLRQTLLADAAATAALLGVEWEPEIVLGEFRGAFEYTDDDGHLVRVRSGQPCGWRASLRP